VTEIQTELLPLSKPRLIDLVEKAGFDVSDWSNYANGARNPGANPRYCYEWCFQQEGLFLLNIWYENMSFEAGIVRQYLNLRGRPSDLTGPRKARAAKFDEAVKVAFMLGANPRVIVQHRSQSGIGDVETRLLDKSPWTVEAYDFGTGDIVLKRGVSAAVPTPLDDPELLSFSEGAKRQAFVWHRKRESKLRRQKIRSVLATNENRLRCEVAGCGFDFQEVYGELGKEFAHVHHLRPLSDFNDDGDEVTIEDLAVVCANCHAMIHRGGDCRPLDGLIPNRDTNV
jgi:putative restriction endonuclease